MPNFMPEYVAEARALCLAYLAAHTAKPLPVRLPWYLRLIVW